MKEQTILSGNHHILMTGKERYPVIGNAVTKFESERIQQEFAYLSVYWDCIEKAKIVRRILKRGKISLGACEFLNADKKSSIEFGFKPPFEFHTWVSIGETVIDFALPGVILMGLHASDRRGPFLTGRKPVILAGEPLDWMRYKKYLTIEGKD